MSDPGAPPENRQAEAPPEMLRMHARDFERLPMVPWFNPFQLADTAYRAVAASVFGAYADKRDVMAAGRGAKVCVDLAGRDEVCIDYVADVGDGWAPTYSVAWLLAQERLRVGQASLKRADALILGGDEVYPTPGRDEYHNRFHGPYMGSLPYVDPARTPPLLFAIPGNHDWYDGLSSFTRLFCQERWIGGRKTSQSRSYFAIQLPHEWWLWGIDTQLHSDLDRAQLEYFSQVVSGVLTTGRKTDGFFKGHKVILCAPSPDWVATEKLGPSAYANLDFLERKIIEENEGSLAVTLTGDLHHYAHYEETPDSARKNGREPQHKITAGGGGAYLYGTHELPEELVLGRKARRFTLKKRFPSKRESRLLVRRSIWAFVVMPHNWSFGGLLAALYLWFSWLLQSTSKMLDTSLRQNQSFLELATEFGVLDPGSLLKTFLHVAAHGPGVALTTLSIVEALIAFAITTTPWKRFVIGGLHGLAHVMVALGSMALFARLNLGWFRLDPDSPTQVSLFIIEMFIVGGFAGSLLMGLYLFLANRLFGMHLNEVFSGQSIPDYKNFLRMQLNARGELTIYPIGVRSVLREHQWEETGNARAQGTLTSEPWWVPKDPDALEPELLGSEIRIPEPQEAHPIGGSKHG